MSIKYALFPNRLTNEANQYRAVTKISGSQDLDGIIDQMMLQGSTVTEADIRAVLTEAVRAATNMLTNGQRVNFGGLVQLWPGIAGKFTGKNDNFDGSRHQLSVYATPGREMTEAFRQKASPEKVLSVKPGPVLFDFIDNATGDVNGAITPGQIGSIVGSRLKYDITQADEGIFFINATDQTEHKVSRVQRNKPSELVFLIPSDIPPVAEFRVEVRARLPRTDGLRIGQMEETVNS